MKRNTDINLSVCYYGDNSFKNSGIIHFSFSSLNKRFTILHDIPLGGKVNFVLETKTQYIIPIQKDKNYIKLVNKFTKKEIKIFETKYFYSYGVLKDSNYGYFASFTSGKDSIMDLEKGKEVDIKSQSENTSRSHFVGILPNQKIYTLDNENSVIITYQDSHQKLVKTDELPLGNICPRLMLARNRYYMITEKSNEIVVFKYTTTFEEVTRIKIQVEDNDFCGGISIDAAEKYIAITIRGSNQVALFSIQADGSLVHCNTIPTGDMPRDIIIKDDYVFITCTNDNKIQVMKIEDNKIIDMDISLKVKQPITFATMYE